MKALIFILAIIFTSNFGNSESDALNGDTKGLIEAILAQNAKASEPMGRSGSNFGFKLGAKDPEIDMDPAEIIAYWGYPSELYTVYTADGYGLTLIRIPHGRYETNDNLDQQNTTTTTPPKSKKKPVVFLQHGLDGSAADWVTNLPNEAAAFVFADAGFEVWLGNFRGNQYSRFHKTLSPKDDAFWEFSWDEMAKYDLPAMINFALNVSQSDQLYYVGYSLGSTAGFAKFSQDHEFAKKVKRFYALAPMVYVKHIKGPMKYFAWFTGAWETFFKIFGIGEFAPPDWVMDILSKYFCSAPLIDLMCTDVLFLIGGPDSKQMNASRVPVYVAHSPGGTSTRTMIHMGQMVQSGKFQAYDYGSRRANKQHYGTDKPPEYDVSKMELAVALYSGSDDWLADPKDVRNLITKLKNMVGDTYLDGFNDFDFIWGLHADAQIYWPMINEIRADSKQ